MDSGVFSSFGDRAARRTGMLSDIEARDSSDPYEQMEVLEEELAEHNYRGGFAP